jgi:hypothetical protein
MKILVQRSSIASTAIATVTAALALAASTAFAQNTAAPAPVETDSTVIKSAPAIPPVATTIYRQVMPDGKVVYSDKEPKGAKVEAITVEPPIKGNAWTAVPAAKPISPQIERSTRVPKVASTAKQRTLDEAVLEVNRAEIILDEAKREQQAGVEPLPGERMGTVSGASRLSEGYEARQKLLAKHVAYAEEALKKAIKNRDTLLH